MRSLAASLLARPCSAAAAARAISSASSGPSVGATFRLTRAFSQEEVDTFVRLTGDANPLHSSAAAGPAGAPPPLVPGMLTGSLFAAIVGTHLPGALYLSQTLRFAAPLLVGEMVLAEVAVTRARGGRLRFATRCVRAAGGEVVVEGEALALLRRPGANG